MYVYDVYVCMYVFMYIRMHVCIYVCMHTHTRARAHTHTHTHTRSTWTQPMPTKKVPLGHLWITSLGVMTHELFDSIRSPNTTAVTLYFLQHTAAYGSTRQHKLLESKLLESIRSPNTTAVSHLVFPAAPRLGRVIRSHYKTRNKH
jgi:hypothetical protein